MRRWVLRAHYSNSQASAAGVWGRLRCACRLNPGQPEGAERRPAHSTNSRHACQPACTVQASCAPAWTSQLRMPRRPALHCGGFWFLGAGTNSAGPGLLTPAGLRLRRPASSATRRALVVGPDGAPEASRDVIASHAAGAAPAPSKRTPLEDAPDEQVESSLAVSCISVEEKRPGNAGPVDNEDKTTETASVTRCRAYSRGIPIADDWLTRNFNERARTWAARRW
jgi:hypothetical protein